MEKLTCKSFILAAVVLAWTLLSGCYTKQQALRKFCSPSKEIVKDSTWNNSKAISSSKVLESESITIQPKAEIETSFNPCDSLGNIIENLNVKLKVGTGTLSISSDKRSIKAKCNCDSSVRVLKSLVSEKDSLLQLNKGAVHHEVKVPPVEIREVIPRWFLILTGAIGIFGLPGIIRFTRNIALPNLNKFLTLFADRS